MWSIAASRLSTTRAAMIASRYSVRQSSSLARVTRASAACAACIPAHRAAPPRSAPRSAGSSRRGAAARCDEKSFRPPPQTPVRRILALTTILARHDRAVRSTPSLLVDGSPGHKNPYDAFEMREHQHPRLALHSLDQALYARHDDVERADQDLRSISPAASRDAQVGLARDRRFRADPLPWRPRRGEARMAADGVPGLSDPPRKAMALPLFEQRRRRPALAIRPLLVDDADHAEQRRAPRSMTRPLGAVNVASTAAGRVGAGRRPPRARARSPRCERASSAQPVDQGRAQGLRLEPPRDRARSPEKMPVQRAALRSRGRGGEAQAVLLALRRRVGELAPPRRLRWPMSRIAARTVGCGLCRMLSGDGHRTSGLGPAHLMERGAQRPCLRLGPRSRPPRPFGRSARRRTSGWSEPRRRR